MTNFINARDHQGQKQNIPGIFELRSGVVDNFFFIMYLTCEIEGMYLKVQVQGTQKNVPY